MNNNNTINNIVLPVQILNTIKDNKNEQKMADNARMLLANNVPLVDFLDVISPAQLKVILNTKQDKLQNIMSTLQGTLQKSALVSADDYFSQKHGNTNPIFRNINKPQLQTLDLRIEDLSNRLIEYLIVARIEKGNVEATEKVQLLCKYLESQHLMSSKNIFKMLNTSKTYLDKMNKQILDNAKSAFEYANKTGIDIEKIVNKGSKVLTTMSKEICDDVFQGLKEVLKDDKASIKCMEKCSNLLIKSNKQTIVDIAEILKNYNFHIDNTQPQVRLNYTAMIKKCPSILASDVDAKGIQATLDYLLGEHKNSQFSPNLTPAQLKKIIEKTPSILTVPVDKIRDNMKAVCKIVESISDKEQLEKGLFDSLVNDYNIEESITDTISNKDLQQLFLKNYFMNKQALKICKNNSSNYQINAFELYRHFGSDNASAMLFNKLDLYKTNPKVLKGLLYRLTSLENGEQLKQTFYGMTNSITSTATINKFLADQKDGEVVKNYFYNFARTVECVSFKSTQNDVLNIVERKNIEDYNLSGMTDQQIAELKQQIKNENAATLKQLEQDNEQRITQKDVEDYADLTPSQMQKVDDMITVLEYYTKHKAADKQDKDTINKKLIEDKNMTFNEYYNVLIQQFEQLGIHSTQYQLAKEDDYRVTNTDNAYMGNTAVMKYDLFNRRISNELKTPDIEQIIDENFEKYHVKDFDNRTTFFNAGKLLRTETLKNVNANLQAIEQNARQLTEILDTTEFDLTLNSDKVVDIENLKNCDDTISKTIDESGVIYQQLNLSENQSDKIVLDTIKMNSAEKTLFTKVKNAIISTRDHVTALLLNPKFKKSQTKQDQPVKQDQPTQ